MKHYRNMRSCLTLLALLAFMLPVTTSCSDDPDDEYFYSFKGEMMSDYLTKRPQYSEFAEIVRRAKSKADDANLMDLLAAYGQYTCFLPNNEAINVYLQKRGLQSVNDLTDADCDTIARTHLVANMYGTTEMDQDRLQTPNMLGRYLSTKIDTVTSDIIIEGKALLIPSLMNDSVENGIVHPIDRVIEQSSSYISDMLRENTRLGIFYEALMATGVNLEIMKVIDDTYNKNDYEDNGKYYYRSHTWSEVAWVPDKREIGYTLFVEPDSVYKEAFTKYGVDTSQGNLYAVYDLACKLYDPVYPNDVSKPGHSFDNLTDSINPLKRFVRYHILNRSVGGTDDLTPLHMRVGATNGPFGIDHTLVNPVDWYQTLLPHTMIKVEELTVEKDLGKGTKWERYINRRYEADDPSMQFEGAHIIKSTEDTVTHKAINGHYFYVDDIVAFTSDVQNKVQNMRIRMDFSTVFPEIMTNKMRLGGIPTADDPNDKPDDDPNPKNGKNYWFPEGYLDGVSFSSSTRVVMRRPHTNFWSWQGDEWNIFGDYDFTFRIPPVPYSGMWQLRLGFCSIETRGVMQVYFGTNPRSLVAQGIPLDMTKYLNSDLYIGSRFETDESLAKYKAMSTEAKAEEQKLLKNLGAYRAPRSTFHFHPTNGTKYYFTGNERTYRRVLCQVYIEADKDYYLRFRVASKAKKGNDNEFMLDYFEMVPSSVYAVDGEGAMEDDL